MSVENINGVAAASVETVNGVAAASVETISGVTGGMASYNSKGAITELHVGYRPVVTYDEDTDRLICVYQDSDNNRLAYVMATLADDGTITAHTDYDIDTASCKPLAIEYHKRLNKVVLLYNDDTIDKAYVKVGTVTGGSTNTISWTSRDLISNQLFTNANGVYTTVHNGGDVVFVKINPNDSQEKFNWIYHIDACDVASAGDDSIIYDTGSTPIEIYRNDQTPDAQDHGITWGNLHGGTNAVNSAFQAGRNSPSSAVTGQLSAWAHVDQSSGDTHTLVDGGWVNLDTDDDTENYHVAWDETIGKGIVVAQSHSGSNDSKPYYWQFTHDNSDQSVTVNTEGAIDSGSSSGYGINCMYNHDAGAIAVAWQHKTNDSPYNLDLRFKAGVVNSSDNNVSWGSSLTLYDGTGGAGQTNNNSGVIPPTSLSPDRVDMCYTSGGRKGIVIAFSRENNGTGRSYLISMSGQGTTDYSNEV